MPARNVHVWYQATDGLDAAAIAAAVSVLSEEERAKYSRFRFAHDARDYAAAHALLRVTLSRDGDRPPSDWRFDRTPGGKPFLIEAGPRRTSFSLSHANGMVACVVTTGSEVGVDVESLDRNVDVDELARRFFAPAEAAELAGLESGPRAVRFFDLWTLKEALSKALGLPLAESLNSLAFTVGGDGLIRLDAPAIEADLWQFGLFAPGARYRLAVAVRRTSPEPVQLIFGAAECV